MPNVEIGQVLGKGEAMGEEATSGQSEVPEVPSQSDYDRMVVSKGLAEVRERIAIESVNYQLVRKGIATQYVDQQTGQKRSFHPGEMAKNLLNLIAQEQLMQTFLDSGLPRPTAADAANASKLVMPAQQLQGEAKRAVEEIITGQLPDAG